MFECVRYPCILPGDCSLMPGISLLIKVKVFSEIAIIPEIVLRAGYSVPFCKSKE